MDEDLLFFWRKQVVTPADGIVQRLLARRYGPHAIAEAASPGAATLDVEFDREGGKDIWEVELDNGLDVKVDASNGVILLTEGRD